MATEPLLISWRAKPSIDPSGSEDTVMSPLHLSVILSASNDLAVRSGKSWPVWCCFVSNVQLLLQQCLPARHFNHAFSSCAVWLKTNMLLRYLMIIHVAVILMLDAIVCPVAHVFAKYYTQLQITHVDSWFLKSLFIVLLPRCHPLLQIIKKTTYNECYQTLSGGTSQVQIASKLIPSLQQM